MKKKLCAFLVLCLLLPCAFGESPVEAPPKPMGEPPEFNGQPPEFNGQPPEFNGQPPEGPASVPEHYDAVRTVSDVLTLEGGTYRATGADENAFCVEGGALTLKDVEIERVNDASSGGDAASFYGVGAAVLATGGTAEIRGGTILTDASGGAGAFAYGSGTITISDTVIETAQDTSGGIHVAGGGTLSASKLSVHTRGRSSAAIRSDRGGGRMTVEGGTYVSDGEGSPAVYVTAQIDISDATLTATGAEALCLEGRNAVTLNNCTLSGNMPDLEGNDTTWTVIVYQSMSGDAEIGKGAFVMKGGALESENGGLFYTTNTVSEFTLENVALPDASERPFLLRCTGNANARGWGRTGENGAECSFTAIDQTMKGDVLWDSISTLDLVLRGESLFAGAVLDDESCAGDGGEGRCTLTVGEGSTWVVTADSRLTALNLLGEMRDEEGKSVTIVNAGGEVLEQGEGTVIVTVNEMV